MYQFQEIRNFSRPPLLGSAITALVTLTFLIFPGESHAQTTDDVILTFIAQPGGRYSDLADDGSVSYFDATQFDLRLSDGLQTTNVDTSAISAATPYCALLDLHINENGRILFNCGNADFSIANYYHSDPPYAAADLFSYPVVADLRPSQSVDLNDSNVGVVAADIGLEEALLRITASGSVEEIVNTGTSDFVSIPAPTVGLDPKIAENGDIYFYGTKNLADASSETGIYRVPAGENTPQLVVLANQGAGEHLRGFDINRAGDILYDKTFDAVGNSEVIIRQGQTDTTIFEYVFDSDYKFDGLSLNSDLQAVMLLNKGFSGTSNFHNGTLLFHDPNSGQIKEILESGVSEVGTVIEDDGTFVANLLLADIPKLNDAGQILVHMSVAVGGNQADVERRLYRVEPIPKSCVDAPEGLIGWWTGNGDAKNQVSGGVDGTLVNGAGFAAGKVGDAFSLARSIGQYVSIGPYAGGSEVTVEAWIQTTGVDPDTFQAIVSSTDLLFLHLQTKDAVGNNVAYTNAGTVFLPIISVSTGSPIWRHVAMTVKSNDSRLYVDGQQIGSSSLTFANIRSALDLRIGSGYQGQRFFDGLIDEVSIYDRALTATEIESIVDADSAGKCLLINDPPVADAGPDQAIRAGGTVFLDGSASFDDNTPSVDLIYDWSFASVPAGSTTVLLDADTAFPSFVADIAGTYTIELTVTDGDGAVSAPDQVEVSSDNLAPTADAGSDQLVVVWNILFLDGSGSSDPENDPLSFSWTITAAPTGSLAELTGADMESPSFLPDLEGVYNLTLEVSDPIGPGSPDTVEIVATTAEDFADIQIVSADETVTALEPALGEVTTEGNQAAFGNFLRQTMVAIQEGDLEEAIDKLQKAIKRTDGCVLRGEPDGNGPGRDWITDCTAQTEIYTQLTDALTALTS